MDTIQDIMDILRYLGSTRGNCGRKRTAAAIAMACENEDRLASIKREIYEVVGKKFGCEASAVERNIRTAAKNAWGKRARLVEIAGYDPERRPTAAQFVEIVSTHILRKKAEGALD